MGIPMVNEHRRGKPIVFLRKMICIDRWVFGMCSQCNGSVRSRPTYLMYYFSVIYVYGLVIYDITYVIYIYMLYLSIVIFNDVF